MTSQPGWRTQKIPAGTLHSNLRERTGRTPRLFSILSVVSGSPWASRSRAGFHPEGPSLADSTISSQSDADVPPSCTRGRTEPRKGSKEQREAPGPWWVPGSHCDAQKREDRAPRRRAYGNTEHELLNGRTYGALRPKGMENRAGAFASSSDCLGREEKNPHARDAQSDGPGSRCCSRTRQAVLGLRRSPRNVGRPQTLSDDAPKLCRPGKRLNQAAFFLFLHTSPYRL